MKFSKKKKKRVLRSQTSFYYCLKVDSRDYKKIGRENADIHVLSLLVVLRELHLILKGWHLVACISL